MITAAILAAALQVYPNCNAVFADWERKLSSWSVARRTIGDDFEQHNYHSVTKDARTIHFTVLAEQSRANGLASIGNFKPVETCMRDGYEYTVYIRVRVK